MPGKTPSKAVQAFVAPIQAALGCFADGKVTADSYDPASQGVLVFNNGEQVTLFGGVHLTLSVSMRYELIQIDLPGQGPWKVHTLGYMYEMQQDNKKIIEYHWHPISTSHEIRPHLHCPRLGKGHVPTGRILIEDVLNYAIVYGATPRNPIKWGQLDAHNRQKFALSAQWGSGPVTVPNP